MSATEQETRKLVIHRDGDGRMESIEEARSEKYSADDRKQMAGKEAMDDGAYPIKDAEDLANAIKAVGLGNAPDQAIRQHIIARAKALDLADQIPSSWNLDGTKQKNSAIGRRKPRHRSVARGPELRFFSAAGLEVRSADNADEIVISGAPIVYDVAYPVADFLGEYQERMAPGVATDALANGADVRFLFNHDGLPLARSVAGTLTIHDTPAELRYTARLDARQQIANDLAIAIERGDVSQMSVGFICAEDEWDLDFENRTVKRFAQFLDISAVTYPASPTTSIDVARRMAFAMPEASRARIDKMFVDLRSGKVLSQGNQDKIMGAVTTLHEVLGSAGVDPSDLIPDDEDETAPEAASTVAPEPVVDEPIRPMASVDPDSGKRSLELERELMSIRRRRAAHSQAA